MSKYTKAFYAISACVGPSFVIFIFPSLNLIQRNGEYFMGRFEPALYVFLAAGFFICITLILFFMSKYSPANVLFISCLCLGPLWILYSEINSRMTDGKTRFVVSLSLFALVFIVSLAIGFLMRKRDTDRLLRIFGIFSACIVISSLYVLAGGSSSDNSLKDVVPGVKNEAAANNHLSSRGDLPNIYHIVLDEMQTEMFEACLNEDLRGALSGFVFFPHATTPFGRTEMSMGALFSGMRYNYDMPPDDYIRGAFMTERSFLHALREAGYTLTGYIHGTYPRRSPSPFDVTYHHKKHMDAASQTSLRMLFASCWMYSSLPKFFSKRLIPDHYFRQLSSDKLLPDEAPVASMLSFRKFMERERSERKSSRYVFLHLILPHFPYVLDENGDYVKGRLTGPLEQTMCAVYLVRQFIDLLKETGRFDRSLILIHGDHGSGFRISGNSLVSVEKKDCSGPEWSHARSRPLMLIKPARSTASGTMAMSEARATIYDIAPTIYDSIGMIPDAHLAGASLLSRNFPWRPVREYHFYSREEYSQGIFHRYIIGADGSIKKMEIVRMTGSR